MKYTRITVYALILFVSLSICGSAALWILERTLGTHVGNPAVTGMVLSLLISALAIGGSYYYDRKHPM